MLAQQRHAIILELLSKDGTVHTSDLTKRLKTSSETIRKDLDLLEQKGLLTRVHGGAVPVSGSVPVSGAAAAPAPTSPELPGDYIPFRIRNTRNTKEKEAIVNYAASLVEERQVIALDYGSTSQMMAAALKQNFQSLTVITNSIQNALILSEAPGFTIILTGGVLSREEYTLSNDFAPILDYLHIDLLFMSVTGIDPVIGLTDQRLNEAKIQNQMRKCASRTIVLSDSSKFGKSSLAKICSLQEVNGIITDSLLPPEMERAIRQTGADLTLVPVQP